MEKSEGLYLGRQAGRTFGPVPITWQPEKLTILGVTISHSLNQDWEKPLKKLTSNLQRWSSRYLSIYGRATIVKTYGLAHFVYLLNFFIIPENIIIKAHKSIFAFLWKKPPEYISRQTLHLPLHKGGLGVPDLRVSNITMKLKWLAQIVNPNIQSPWVAWARFYQGKPLGLFKPEWNFLRSNNVPSADETRLPEHYHLIRSTCQEHRSTVATFQAQSFTLSNLKSMVNTLITPKSITHWQSQPHLTANQITNLWDHIWSSLNTNEEKETLWRIAHRILPTRAYLHSWGPRMGVASTCPFCTSNETLEHALLQCQRIQPIWIYVASLVHQLEPAKPFPPLLQEYLFPPTQTLNPDFLHLFHYLTTTAINVIWYTRNKLLKLETAKPLVELYQHQIHIRIKYDILNNKLSNLRRFWTYKNLLATSENDRYTIRI